MKATSAVVLAVTGAVLLVAASGLAGADPGTHEVQIVNESGDVNASYYYDSSTGSVNVTEDGGNSWTKSTLSNPDESAKAIEWALGNVSAVNDTVLVGPGTYNGTVTVGYVTVTAPAGPSQTTLNPVSGSTGIAGIRVLGDGAVVRNFTVAGYDSSSNVAIEVNGENATVADNVVRNNQVGISDSSPDGGGSSYVNNTVVDNLASGVLIRANLTTVRDNRVWNNSGHGVVLRHHGDSIVRENSIRQNGYGGIYVNNSVNNTFEANEISENDGGSNYYGIKLTNGSDRNRVIDSTIENTITANGGILANDTRNVVIQNNTISDKEGIEITSSSWATVAENTVTVTRADPGGITVSAAHSYVRNNTVRGGGQGITIEGKNVTALGNDVRESTSGMMLSGTNHTVSSNVVTNTTVGFDLDDIANSTLASNEANGNVVGVQVYESTNNTLTTTLATDNSKYGIYVSTQAGRQRSSHDNVFVDTIARGNDDAALYAHGVVGSTNVFTGLDIGASTNAGTTVDVEAKNVSISAVQSAPSSPSNLDSIGRLVDVTNTSAPADSVNLTLHYEESDLDNFDDSTLALYNHTGSWTEVSGASHDDGNDSFSATFTDYGVIGLYAESTSTSGGSASGGGGGYYLPPSDDADHGSTNDTDDGDAIDDTADDDSTPADTGDGEGSEPGNSPGEDADGESDDTGAEETPDEETPDIEESNSGSFPWWLLLLLLLLALLGAGVYYREEIREQIEEYRD